MATMLHDTKKAGHTGWGSVKERAEHALEIAKSKMGPIKEQAEHVAHDARVGLESARKSAEHAFDSAAEHGSEVANGKSHDLSRTLSTFSTLIKGLGVAAGIAKTVQSRDPERGIPWSRPGGRGSTAGAIAVFGIGLLAGAAAATLLAPERGASYRAALARRFEVVRRQAMQVLDLFTSTTGDAYGAPPKRES